MTQDIMNFEVVVIGAGVVGLSIATNLAKRFSHVLLVDKERTYGQHVSSRNSETVHSGIYYDVGSLKATLCLEGNALLKELAERYNIPYRNCGKLIVAPKEKRAELEALMSRGKANGVEGLELIHRNRIKELEPLIKSELAIHVPSAGVIDTHSLLSVMNALSQEAGVIAAYGTEVSSIDRVNDGYRLGFKGENYSVQAPTVVNCAGLWSDKVSEMLGIDSRENNYTLSYCKGEYFRTNRYKDMNCLVYPLPGKNSLGIHTKLALDNSVSFGPNAYFVDEIDYNIDTTHRAAFVESIREYLDIDEEDLWEDFAAIRPKPAVPSDFIIKNEADKGYPDFINLIGIESPGLTSCLAIANYVEKLL